LVDMRRGDETKLLVGGLPAWSASSEVSRRTSPSARGARPGTINRMRRHARWLELPAFMARTSALKRSAS
jgi:hypothetical protein